MSDMASPGPALHLHVAALRALRSRLPKEVRIGDSFKVKLGRILVTADTDMLLVYLDDTRVYGWEKRGDEVHSNYKPALLNEALTELQKELVLESLSDV